MPLAALTIAIACYLAYWRIRFRNCRIQNSNARLVFEERKFFHITPLLKAPPPHFYTFEAPSPPLPHFYSFPPPTPHFYCFPSNTTSSTFHCFPSHTHTCTPTLSAHFYCFPSTTSTTFRLFSLHHHLHHNSIVFRPQPQHMYFFCFPSTSFTTTSSLLFFIHNLQHISMVSHPLHSPHFHSFPAPLPPTHSYCFPSTTTTTFLLFSIYHVNHISIVFLFPLHQYQISKLPPPEPPPSNFYVFFISMLTHRNEEKNRFGQGRARE